MKRNCIAMVLCAWLAVACQSEDFSVVSNNKEVSLGLSVHTTEMQQAGSGVQTRSISDAMDITFGADPVTRSSKNPDETAIKSLYLVQFNGTAAGSTVVKSGSIIRNATDNTAMFDFAVVNATCRVYVVANFNPNATNGTSLGSFERMMATYLPATSVAATGLPMCGYVDFNPATTVNTPQVSLKAMVAKLTVTYTMNPAGLPDFKPGTTVDSLNIKLRNVPNGTAYGVATNFTTAWRPTNVTYVDVPVGRTGSTYTYYVPENIAGNGSTNITNWSRRNLANAPANALYFEVTGRNKTNDGTITIASFIGDPNDLRAFNIERNYAYTLTATIKNVDMADERITVEPDYFDLNANLGDSTANCYIITANSSLTVYSFDATVRGNNVTTVQGISYDSLPDLRTTTEARVLWQTGGFDSVIKSVKYERGGRVHFTMGTATEGNAVIGIFASDATDAPCLWSWHIWKLNGSIPADVPCVKDPSPITASANFNMMALNLGAYNNTPGDIGSIGLLYQWGRKDPFPGPADFNSTETNIYGTYNNGGVTGTWSGRYSIQTTLYNSGVTEAWEVRYPTAFITSVSGIWLNTQNNSLWGTPWAADGGVGGYNGNQGVKSIYDPCPVGYRVPPEDTWSKQTGNGTYENNGIIMTSMNATFWFPGPGVRGGAGQLFASSEGRYWVSSSKPSNSESTGTMFFYDSGVVAPIRYITCADANSVRCVAE